MSFAILCAALAACSSQPEATNEMPIRDQRPVAAERYFPEDLQQDGRLALTPGFSPDGNTMYLTQGPCAEIGACPQQLKVAQRTATGWSTPVPLSRVPGRRSEAASVSPDGKTLLFSWSAVRARHDGADAPEDFDLYRLDLDDPSARPEPIDEPDINRIRGGRVKTLRFVHNETAPILTKAGNLYFWSERLDAVGERDGFIALTDGQGGFLSPEPLSVNSEGREDWFWTDPDETILFFSSPDRGGEGGSDIFVARRGVDGNWSAPVNMGAAVNSEADDYYARLTPDGQTLLFTSTRAFEGQPAGLAQIWSIPVSAVEALQ